MLKRIGLLRKILYRGIASDLFDEVLGTYQVADEFSLRAAIGGGKIRGKIPCHQGTIYEKVSEPKTSDLGGCGRRGRNIGDWFLIFRMDARQHRRADGERAGTKCGRSGAGTY